MEIRQLRYFVQTAEFGSISRAALSLQVAQSAVSRQISCLEAHLGIPLLVRHGRGVTLSEFGKSFLVHAQAILEEVTQAERSARTMSREVCGLVTIAAPWIVAPIVIPHVMREVHSRYGGIELRIIEGQSATIADWVAKGSIDLGIYYTNRERSDGYTDLLFREPLGLIGRASDERLAEGSIPFCELVNFDLILPRPDHHLRITVDKVAKSQGVQLKVVMKLEMVSAIMEMVRMGEGLTILPLAAVSLDKPGYPLRAVPIVSPAMKHILVSRMGNGSENSTASRQVTQVVRQQVARLVRENMWR